MNQPINISINGKTYNVEVGDLSISPVTVTVNGIPYTVEMSSPESPTSLARPEIQAPAVQPKPVVAIPPKPLETPAQPSAGGAGGEIRSPMPGVILDIMVKPGDQVQVGQQLCALEAMKMKSAIKSPRAGTIASVAVSEGQRVAFGETIIRFD